MNDRPVRRRGVLSLLSSELAHHPFDIESLNESTSLLRKRKRRQQQQQRQRQRQHALPLESVVLDPTESEFTLFYFFSTDNLNSIRFRPVLAKFVDKNRSKCHCVAVSNDDYNDHHNDVFLAGTGFRFVPWDHPHRTALVRLLAVPCVPSVVVVENSTGRRITEYGMQAIEAENDDLFPQWRNHTSGLSYSQWMSAYCLIS